MYKKKYGYSAINTARVAVSSVNDMGSHPLVCRFMRGVFNLRPSCPRYTYIWDLSLVLKYLRTLAPSTGLKLQSLSAKLATLCALVTGHRCQTFHAMDILCYAKIQANFRRKSYISYRSFVKDKLT
ncbi:xerd_0 protein [Plakobranchus ocellatus]|uniref:Xerd_0 protein n=1 Tax=Plakobranchus ocellatus TaxID=259542 RepID=A0AAV3Z8W2_9GAST|nr:xerd_0 protein [Plakobranchus ocellatus]